MKNNSKDLEAAITRGLAEEKEGSVDGLEAAIGETTERYRTGMKKVSRITFLYLLVLTAIAVVSMYKFCLSQDVKGLIAWGVIFLLALENTILIKLWFWIMNTKIDLLKEMKTLRFEMAGVLKSDEKGKPFRIRPMGMSRKEQVFWFVLLISVSGLIGYHYGSKGGRWFSFTEMKDGVMGSQRTVTLREDGSALVETDYSFPNESVFPMRVFSMYSGDKGWQPTYSTIDGQEIPSRFCPEKEGIRITLHLPEPVKPGERLLFHQKAETPNGAIKEGDEWLYRSSQAWGYGRCEYRETIVFPKGVEVTWSSKKPQGIGEENQDGLPFRVYSETSKYGAGFEYRLRYTLN